jgi:hypothetical protein
MPALPASAHKGRSKTESRSKSSWRRETAPDFERAEAPTGVEPVFVASVVILVYVRRSPASPAIASPAGSPASERFGASAAGSSTCPPTRYASRKASRRSRARIGGERPSWLPRGLATDSPSGHGSAFVGDVHPGHGSRLGACYSRKREGTRPAPFQAKKCPPGMDADMPLTRPSQNRQPTSKPATRGTAGWKTPTGRPAGRSMILSSLRVCLFARTAAKGRSDGGPNFRRLTARANS